MSSGTSRPTPSAIPHEVLSAVSHELRGPLGVTRGYLRLLETRLAGDADARRSVEQAAAAATRMAELLDELSEYARWVRGEATLTPAPTLIPDLLAEAARGLSRKISSSAQVVVEAQPDTTVEVDAPRMARALAALISALARAQHPDTTVLLSADDRGVLQVRLSHAPQDSLKARPPTIERAGAGLSIALAAIVVERHGGRLSELWAGEELRGYRVELRIEN